MRDRNQIEEAQDRMAEERQAQEDLLGGDDANGCSEDEVESAVERPRRKRKRPDLYGDSEYEREEESE